MTRRCRSATGSTDGYIDAGGARLELPRPDSPRAVTLVERDGRPLAALVHDPAVLDDPGLVEGVAAAARLAAANARLNAEVRTQLAELAASRRRIVEAGDEERRRLELRLRDGTVRRLEALDTSLAAARAGAGPASAARLEQARHQLARALDDLRELALGLHPRDLVDEGLEGALTGLAARSTVPVDLDVAPVAVPQAAEAAAYFLCSEALTNVAKYASASRVAISVARHNGHLAVDVADDGVGGADPARGSGLRGLADRVEALGGTLRVDSRPGGGTHLQAVIPVADDGAVADMTLARACIGLAAAAIALLTVFLVPALGVHHLRRAVVAHGHGRRRGRPRAARGRARLTRGRVGIVALLASVAWFAPDWLGWEQAAPLVRSLATAAALFATPLLLHVAAGSASRALYAAAAVGALGLALVHDPFLDPNCWSNCTDNVFLLHGDQSIARVLETGVLIAFLAGASSWPFARRGARPRRSWRPPRRPTPAPCSSSRRSAPTTPSSRRCSCCAPPRSRCSRSRSSGCAYSAWRTRAAVARLATELGEAPPPGTLRAALATSLGDPGVEVVYPARRAVHRRPRPRRRPSPSRAPIAR